jgi:uncharacterized protein (DUF302 family)
MPGAVENYTTKPSPWSVTDTVRRLTTTMTERGVAVFAVIDQRAAACTVGMTLRETVLVVFGSPAAGTPVMDAEPLAALDLPLKLVVWDDSGRTVVSYLSPVALAARHRLPDSLAAPMAGIDHLTDLVLNEAPAITDPEDGGTSAEPNATSRP